MIRTGMRRHARHGKGGGGHGPLALIPMIDMLTILVVYLLGWFNVDTAQAAKQFPDVIHRHQLHGLRTQDAFAIELQAHKTDLVVDARLAHVRNQRKFVAELPDDRGGD